MVDMSDSLRKDLTPEEFQRFRDWIHRHSGIFLEESKVDSLRISLVTRATRLGFLEYDEYFRLLESDEAEFKELMNLVTINETSFFRFPAQFDALRDVVIPEILEGKPKISRSFRVWSAGCSTGEEPYTIAMTLLDSGLEGLGYRPEVFGTDVSTQALERAKAGIYPAKALATLPQQVTQRWFEPVPGGHRPIERARKVCEFAFHNLIKEPYPLALHGNWDVVFCRNVTIYFRVESTRRVVQNFYDSLNPGGYLFIGHSETLTSISDQFEPVEINGVFLYRKPRPRRAVTFGDVIARREGRTTTRESTVSAARRAIASGGTAVEPRRPFVRPSAPPVEKPAAAVEETLTVPELLASARRKLDEGQPAVSLELARRALSIEPRSADALLVAAFAHADAGDLADAMEEATRALEIDPLLAPARYVLGVIMQQRGDMDGALSEFKRTVYIDSEFVLAHFAMANIHRGRGRTDDACREYQNTLAALRSAPTGQWTAFLGGFEPDLLARTCERSLIECRKGTRKR